MIAGNNLREDLPLADWDQLQTNEQQIIDVRSPAEFSSGHRPGAVNIPLEEMRQRAQNKRPSDTASSHLEQMFRPLVGSGRGDEDESGRRRHWRSR
jgi:rhodanese-related sulfurtransferase